MTTEYSGSGDLQRTLDLMWGTATAPTRGPRPGLTVESIVEVAIGVADAEGLPAVSMRRIASELGIGVMGLYRYVPGKSELVDLMLDAVQATIPDPYPAGDDWRSRLRVVAQNLVEHYRRHRWLLEVSQARPLMGPQSIRTYDDTLRCMDGIGLTDHEMAWTVTMLDSLARGASQWLVEYNEAAERTGISDEDWWATQMPYIEKAMADGKHETMARVVANDPFEDDTDYVIDRALDGIAALIAGR